MSRSTIFGVAGATIGFLLTAGSPVGAQWGWMIGSGVGALTDNTKTYGPRASDAAQQQTQDGTFATYGYGEFVTTGIIMWRAERKEKKHKQGKGGPSNISYSYSWTYAIGICRKGPINGILLVRRNGTIVFDARSNAELEAIGYTKKQIKETRAAQAKWLKKAKFYYGHADQSADPSIQAIKGINNTPRYPGTAYVVLTDEDVTNDGAAIPSYEFVVSACGTKVQAEDGGEILITGSETEVAGPVFAIAEVADVPTPVAIPTSTGADEAGMVGAYHDGKWVAASWYGTRVLDGPLSTTASWTTGTLTGAPRAIEFVGASDSGEWAAKDWTIAYSGSTSFNTILAGDPSSMSAVTTSGTDSLGAPFTMRHQLLRFVGGYWYSSQSRGIFRSPTLSETFTAVWDEYDSAGAGWDPSGATIIGFYDVVKSGSDTYFIVRWHFNDGLKRIRIWCSPDGGFTMDEANVEWDQDSEDEPLQLIEIGGKIVALCSNFDVITNASGTFERVSTGVPRFPAPGGAITLSPWEARKIETDGERVYIVGGSYMVVSLDKGLTWGDPILLPISNAKSITIGNTAAGNDVPDAPGWKYDASRGLNGGVYTTVHPCVTTLDEIVANQCAIRNVNRVVVDELEDTVVRGFRVATQTSPKDNIRSLQGSFFFDASDHDGYLHFLMRPQPATFVITQDDMVASEDRALQWEVTKENSILRKVSTTYFDPRANYATTSQDWERKVSVLQAQGEGTFDSALTANATFVKQLCEKSVKVAFAEKDEMTCRVRLNHAARHPGEWGKVQDEDGEFHIARITRVEVEGITRKITFRKTSRAAYTASALGVNGPLPSFPGSGILGATTSVLMNAPVMVDANDKPGIAWAAAGMTTGWRGAILQVQRNDWETVGQIDAPSTIGTLSEDLPEFDGTWDTVNTLHVTLDGDAASISFTNLLREGNPLAIVRPDGLTEILQYQTAVEVSAGQWSLSNLIRGRMDTENVAHVAGAKVVMLDTSVKFVQLRYDDAGKTLNFRAVSNGTDPDAAQVQTLTLSPMESLREWQPWNVTVTPWYSGNETDGGSGYCVAWIGRARLGTDLTPVHSQNFAGYRVSFSANGETYTIDTYEQSVCVPYATLAEHFGPSFPWPDVTVTALSKVPNVDEEPVDPVTPPPAPGGQTSTGAPAAGSLGPNGGFPDNTPYPIPEPTTFGTDVIDGGGFSSAGDISDWRDSTGAPLDSRWSIVDGRLCFHGIGVSTAYYWPERRTMAQQVIPHYSYEITAEIESDAGAKARIGIATGYSTAGTTVTLQDGVYGTPATEYGEPTVVSHTYADDRTSYGATGNGQTVFVIVAPAVQARVESAQMARVYFDNVTFEVSENAPSTTPFAPSNIDFSSGLAGWVQYPAASAMSPSPTVSSGEVTFTPVSEYGTHKYLICADPITSLDALDKWVRISAEVNCNDPTVVGGFTRGGVGLSYAISADGGATYEYTGWANPVERGDWTERFRWMRRSLSGTGITYHACILFKAAVGYRSSVRSISLDVTDAPVT